MKELRDTPKVSHPDMLRICWDLTEKRVILTYHMFCKRLQQHRGDGNPPWLPNFPAFSTAMESSGHNWCNCSEAQPITAASGHPPWPYPNSTSSDRRTAGLGGGDRGLFPRLRHPRPTLLPELHRPRHHLPWSRLLHLTVRQGNRAVKTQRNDWKRAVTTLQST